MSQGIWVLMVAVAAAGAFGTWRALGDGRFRGTRPVPAASGGDDDTTPASGSGGAALTGIGGAQSRRGPSGDSPAGPPAVPPAWPADQCGQRATLLQFSSAFCTPCRATRRVLGEVADLVPGVRHVEVDAEEHLDLVRSLGILRTPTTLVLDADGREVSRASGAPRKDAVLATLGRVLGD